VATQEACSDRANMSKAHAKHVQKTKRDGIVRLKHLSRTSHVELVTLRKKIPYVFNEISDMAILVPTEH
jgi:hypothetical protein